MGISHSKMETRSRICKKLEYKTFISNPFRRNYFKVCKAANTVVQELLNKPKCPTCNSQNIKKISATSKVVNTAVFGIFGTKRHKQFHCNNCGYEW